MFALHAFSNLIEEHLCSTSQCKVALLFLYIIRGFIMGNCTLPPEPHVVLFVLFV